MLRANYPSPPGVQDDRGPAAGIAGHFVNAYPEHAFMIDRDELRGLLPRTLLDADPNTQGVIDRLEGILTDVPITALGRVVRRSGDG